MNNINDNNHKRSHETIPTLPKARHIPVGAINGLTDNFMRNRGLYPINYITKGNNHVRQSDTYEEGMNYKTKLSYLNNNNSNNDKKVNIVLNPFAPFKFKPNQLPSLWKKGSKPNLGRVMNIAEVSNGNWIHEHRPRSTIKKDIIKAKDIDSSCIPSATINVNNDPYHDTNLNSIKTKGNIENDNENDSSNTARMISHNIIGLDNLGNTCYMNTCLQLIIHCDTFIQRLIKAKGTIDQLTKQKNITKSFYNLCLDILNVKGKRSVAPIDFKTSFSRAHFEFRGYGQHDTQECCRVLLDDISNELNVNKIKPKYKELDTNKKPKTQLKKDFNNYIQSIENSIVTETFYGQIQTSFICPCGSKSHTYQRFLDIPILFPETTYQGNGFELEELLKDHFKDDSIKWESKCDDCHQKTDHEKIMRLVHLPDVLILSFQRYNSRTRTKNSSCIKYPSVIDLVKYVDLECNDNDKFTQYNLIGISNHSGNMGFGHYYA